MKAEGRGQEDEGKGLLSDCCSRSIDPNSLGYSYKAISRNKFTGMWVSAPLNPGVSAPLEG
jgi:hypothetical protein